MKTIYYLYEIGEDVPMYVGCTSQILKKRLAGHKCGHKENIDKKAWIKKAVNGGGLGIKEIETVEDSVSLERDIFWTNEYFKLYPLVNLRIGTGSSEKLGKILSAGQKKKVVDYAALDRLHKNNIGLKRSKEFCENLSKRFKGIKRPESTCLKTREVQSAIFGKKVTVDGVYYPSIGEAARQTGINKSTIQQYLAGNIPNYKKHVIKCVVYP